MKERFLYALVFFGFLSVSSVLFAAAFRCGNDLIAEGRLKIQVLDSCGEPLSKEVIGVKEYKDPDFKESRILEEWIYDTYSAYYRILFEGSRVVRIDSIRK